VPAGSTNIAFLGQFVEIADDVVFTVEYSFRGAMHGGVRAARDPVRYSADLPRPA
jgi:myosin-crossreactive antigen